MGISSWGSLTPIEQVKSAHAANFRPLYLLCEHALTEENGCIEGADSSNISNKAVERGFNQIGTLGSGNHYLEVQFARPENIFDWELAKAFGITKPNQVVVMFHCGSR